MVTGHIRGDAITVIADIWGRPTPCTRADFRARAMRTAAGHAHDAADLADLLRMLGLTDGGRTP